MPQIPNPQPKKGLFPYADISRSFGYGDSWINSLTDASNRCKQMKLWLDFGPDELAIYVFRHWPETHLTAVFYGGVCGQWVMAQVDMHAGSLRPMHTSNSAFSCQGFRDPPAQLHESSECKSDRRSRYPSQLLHFTPHNSTVKIGLRV